MKRLTRSDKYHVDAAEGWLELGSHLDAKEELQQISAPLRKDPRVLVLRHKIYSAEKKWRLAAEAASALCKLLPGSAFGFIRLAHSLHEMKRTREAREILKQIADRFSGEFIIRYNLACYECQLGNLKRARELLKRAIELGDGPLIKATALEDVDLKPLWKEISAMSL